MKGMILVFGSLLVGLARAWIASERIIHDAEEIDVGIYNIINTRDHIPFKEDKE
jgi:hypothetical protein